MQRRIGKKVDGELTRAWLYQDGLRPIAELDGEGNVVSRFVYGTRVNVPDYLLKGGSTYRIIPDHLGSPRFVVDVATSVVVQEMRYDEFGRITLDTSPGFQPFGFAGGLYDPQTGLIRYGARDYDPEIGRWTTPDPSGFAGGLNLYVYADQNPQSFIDRTGEVPAAVVLAWGLIEAGLTIWDIYETGTTLMDPCASLGDKAMSGGGLMMGAVLPGGGYGAGGKAGKKALGAGRKGGGDQPFVPEEYWTRKAPKQVAPGTERLDWSRISSRTGEVEESRVIYDELGRIKYRVDKTDHMRPSSHSNPHLHEFDYGPGLNPHRETLWNLPK